jgi:hypothetical protein
MKISHSSVFGSKSFWITLALFAAANLTSVYLVPPCCDQFDGIGFPLSFHISGGIAGASNFYAIALALDLIIALTVALLAAWIGAAYSSRR